MHIIDTNFSRSDFSRSDLYSDFDDFDEIDEIDEFDELDEFDECDEFDELGISFIGRVVHGAMLKNFLFQMLKRPSAYQNLIYFRTYSEDHHHILDLLEKRPHFALV